MKNKEDCWNYIIEKLKENEDVSPLILNTFFKSSTPVELTDNKLTIVTPIDVYKTHIKKHTLEVEGYLSEYTDNDSKIEILLESEYKNPDSNKKNVTAEVNPSGLNPDFTFDEFVTGKSNDYAYALSVSVASDPGGDEGSNPLFMYGGVGLGKTHLIHAIGNYILSQHPDYKIKYIDCLTFTEDFIASIRNKQQSSFKNIFRNLDVLLMDDVQSLSNRESVQDEFFTIFNRMISQKKQIVMCSDRRPQEIPDLADRLSSRMAQGLTADLKFPDFDTRVAILSKKCKKKNISVPNDVLEFIADSSQSNIREMLGHLNKIFSFSKFTNMKIDLDLARESLKDSLNNGKPQLTIDYIVKTTAEFYKLTPDNLLSDTRVKEIKNARQVAMYLCRKHLNDSLSNIGKKFGKNHTTVSHSCDRVQERLEKEPIFSMELKNIENNF